MKTPTKRDYHRASVLLDAATLARIDALASAIFLSGGRRKRALAIQAALLMGLEAFATDPARAIPSRRPPR